MVPLLPFLICFLCMSICQSQQNCSDLSIITTKGDNIVNHTFTSAQAPFPPYAYSDVPWTPFVILPNTDTICNESSPLFTNISRKVVLLFEEYGNCSAQLKVLIAQNNGAIAVIMANTDETGTVFDITNDVPFTGTTAPIIPMRSIPKSHAQTLLSGTNIEIQIECNTEHEAICLSNNGTVSSLLQGLYTNNGINTDEYNTMEFISSDASLYVWYHDNKWWLSPVDYMTKHETDASLVEVYGYCSGGEIDIYPICEDCWVFFWELLVLSDVDAFWKFKTKSFKDCGFTLSTALAICEDDVYEADDIEYPDRWCVYHDAELPQDIEPLIGTYENKHSGIVNNHYKHTSNALYMWHNSVTNLWFIGLEEGSSPVLLCYPQMFYDNDDEEQTLNNCVLWEAGQTSGTSMGDMLYVTTDCDLQVVDEKGMSTGEIIGIAVASILGIIGCFVIIYCGVCSYKRKQEQEHDDIDMKETEMGPTPFTPDDVKKPRDSRLEKKFAKLDQLDAERFSSDHIPQETYDMDALNVRDEDGADPLTDN